MSIINRRSLITGLISLVAAPAIVRVQNIMPVKNIKNINYNVKIGKLYICTQAGQFSEWADIGDAFINSQFGPIGIQPWRRQTEYPILGQIKMTLNEFNPENLPWEK